MMDTHADNAAKSWQAYLAGLPAVEPPNALRERSVDACMARVRQQRAWWRAGSLAAGIAIALAGVALWTHETGPVDGPGPSVSDLVRAPVALPGDSRLTQLDDVIAQAYASDLSEIELQSLWQARASLLVENEEVPSALLVQL